MSKKKKKDSNGFSDLLMGALYIVIGLLGLFGYGPVGKFICALTAFFFGKYLYIVILGLIILLGVYVLLKGKYPNFFNSKLVGIYILLIGLMILLHIDIVKDETVFSEMFSKTLDNCMKVFSLVEGTEKSVAFKEIGSGLIGGTFASLSKLLVDYKGSQIIYWVFIITGTILFTGVSIADLINKFKDKSKELIDKQKINKENKRLKEEEDSNMLGMVPGQQVKINLNDNNTNEDKGNKKVINSIDEIINKEDKNKVDIKVPEEKTNNEVEETVKIVDNVNYQLPTVDLLDIPKKSNNDNQTGINENIEKLENVLAEFGITAKVISVTVGPACSQYELSIRAGTKLSKLTSLNKEISLALAKKDVRIQAPIPGKSTCGIEIANDKASVVYIREIMENIPKDKADKKLLVALGKDINGNVRFCEINKTPHMLVAGSTGSGKSVCINCILASILMRTKPDEVKLLLVDPKKVELSGYNGVPHLLRPVVTDPKKASAALQMIVQEMEHRYNVFEEKGVKNIDTYNEWVDKQNKDKNDDDKIKKMPFIVVIVDELADLMVVASKEVEESIMRITQMARAAGIHLIIATQRPSTDVITGVIKANIPSRISFAVSSYIDSRTILDMSGAEKLLGRGDMLFLPQGENTPTRIQGAWITEDETKRLVDFVCNQQKAQYDQRFEALDHQQEEVETGVTGIDANHDIDEEYDDPLYNDIVEFVITSGKASASLLQRRFKVGYNRAARIIDLLEERGIIGPQNGSKPREVLVKLNGDNSDDSSEDGEIL